MDKIYSLLGFAQRARKLVSGEQAVDVALRKGKVNLLIIASDSSENIQRKFKAIADTNNVNWFLVGTKAKLGQSVGKSQRSLLGIIDSDFAKAIRAHLI